MDDGSPPVTTDRSINARGFYTISSSRAETIAARYVQNNPLAFNIHRAEVVLTEHCNLKCSFCQGLPTAQKSRLTIAELRRLFQAWRPAGIRYVHFTGGEPTVWPGLREAVEVVAGVGATACMTSNGIAPFSLYRDLVARGLRDIRISLHAHTPELGGQITGRRGAFEKAVENLRELVELRDRLYPDLYVMINTTLSDENLPDFPDLLDFLMRFRANDVKPVVVVQWDKQKLDAARQSYAREILPRLMQIPHLEQFPILRYRLPTLFTQRLRGLMNGDRAAGPVAPRCYLMLDDRCVDSQWYYPCNIFVRERGAPLGSYRADNLETIARRTWQFVHEHNFAEDPICQRCCPDITREYNWLVSNLIHEGHTGNPTARPILC